MNCHPFIYGKGKRFQYGTELIAPILSPVAQELESLAAYDGSCTGSRSIRWGRLRGGDRYLSFAFSLPQGSAADQRAQVRVVTFVFPKGQGCPLTPALLRALPALTLEEVEAMARSGDTIPAQALCAAAPADLPPPSPDFLAAVVSTLFFQTAKPGRPALLAQTRPEELLAALAALPPWLLEKVTFNTDVRAVSEPLQLLNVWTASARLHAESTNYSGASRDRRLFFYPAQADAQVHVGGLEREATRFLALTPAAREDLAAACDYDLGRLLSRLSQPEAPPAQPPRHAPTHHVKAPPPCPADLCRGLCLLLLLLGGGLGCYGLLAYGGHPLLLPLLTTCFCLLGAAFLGWGVFRLAEHLARDCLDRWHTAIRTRGTPAGCRRLQRVCKGMMAALAAAGLLLSLWTLAAGAAAVLQSWDAAGLPLAPAAPLPTLLAAHGLGALVWFLGFLARLRTVCLRRLGDAAACQEDKGKEDLPC